MNAQRRQRRGGAAPAAPVPAARCPRGSKRKKDRERLSCTSIARIAFSNHLTTNNILSCVVAHLDPAEVLASSVVCFVLALAVCTLRPCADCCVVRCDVRSEEESRGCAALANGNVCDGYDTRARWSRRRRGGWRRGRHGPDRAARGLRRRRGAEAARHRRRRKARGLRGGIAPDPCTSRVVSASVFADYLRY